MFESIPRPALVEAFINGAIKLPPNVISPVTFILPVTSKASDGVASLIPTLLLVGSTYNTPLSTFSIPVIAVVSLVPLPKVEFPLTVIFPVRVVFPVTEALPPTERFPEVTERLPGLIVISLV